MAGSTRPWTRLADRPQTLQHAARLPPRVMSPSRSDSATASAVSNQPRDSHDQGRQQLVVPGPRAAEENPGTRRSQRRVRDVTVAVASAGVLCLLVLYAIAAPSVSMTASAGSVVPLPGRAAVVLGRVLGSDGGGLKGARVEVRQAGGETAIGMSNAAGAFRVSLPGRCAFYTVSIRAPAQGSTVAATVRHRLCPGDALPVDARVVTQGQFLWVPGPR
jgi:hypothetical protein